MRYWSVEKDRAGQMEQLVDSLGMIDFLEILEGICYEKSDHIRTNWQDEELAKCWERNAKTLSKVKVSNCY